MHDTIWKNGAPVSASSSALNVLMNLRTTSSSTQILNGAVQTPNHTRIHSRADDKTSGLKREVRTSLEAPRSKRPMLSEHEYATMIEVDAESISSCEKDACDFRVLCSPGTQSTNHSIQVRCRRRIVITCI